METVPKKMLTVKECWEIVGVSRNTMYRMLEGRPGVHRFRRKGSSTVIIRVEPFVVESLLRESSAA